MAIRRKIVHQRKRSRRSSGTVNNLPGSRQVRGGKGSRRLREFKSHGGRQTRSGDPFEGSRRKGNIIAVPTGKARMSTKRGSTGGGGNQIRKHSTWEQRNRREKGERASTREAHSWVFSEGGKVKKK